MGLDELLSLLFFLYVLGSVLSSLVRRSAPPGTPGETPDEPDVIVDMEELERRLRRARVEHVGEPLPPAARRREELPAQGPGSSSGRLSETSPAGREAPAIPKVRVSAARAPKPTVRRSRMAPRIQGVAFHDDLGEEWVSTAAVVPRRAGRRQGGVQPFPPAVAAILETGRPWLAAMVTREILDAPRALRPYRIWPRV